MSAAKSQSTRTPLDDDYSSATQEQEVVPSEDDELARSTLLQMRSSPHRASGMALSTAPARGARAFEVSGTEDEEAGETSSAGEGAARRKRRGRQQKALSKDVVFCLLTAFNAPRSSLYDKVKKVVLWAKLSDSMIKHPSLRGHLDWVLTTANFQVTVRNKTKALYTALCRTKEDAFLAEYASAEDREHVRQLIPRALDFLHFIDSSRGVLLNRKRRSDRYDKSEDEDDDDDDSGQERKEAHHYAFRQHKSPEKEAPVASRNEEREQNGLAQKRRRVEPVGEPPVAHKSAAATAETSSSNNEQLTQLVQMVTRQHHEIQSMLSNITALLHRILSVL